uniref:Protein prenyltransferase alpha subunit repeat-containing protein 1 n=1 Tax=Timema shepardi TaxID=629360 RepID=A0A7R9AKV9_TIMSH|nr:unnamed protein product [Timema shepardi]
MSIEVVNLILLSFLCTKQDLFPLCQSLPFSTYLLLVPLLHDTFQHNSETLFLHSTLSKPMASLVLIDSSQLTSDSQHLDPATLSRLLCGTLLLNPDISTFWGMRRELVQSGTLSGHSELHYTTVLLSRKPKCSEAFAHHGKGHEPYALASPAPWHQVDTKLTSAESYVFPNSTDVNELLEEELRVSQYAADRYPNNYYAWSHRMWCVGHLVASTSEHQQRVANSHKNMSDGRGELLVVMTNDLL